MIQKRTILNVADNTGIRKLQCVGIMKGTNHRYARLGDIITGSAKDVLATGTIKKGEVVKAVVVRTCKEHRRKDGSYVRFDDNACVVIDDNNDPRGTRIFGPIARELRERNFVKIISLAPEIV